MANFWAKGHIFLGTLAPRALKTYVIYFFKNLFSNFAHDT
jgi:hypothetical protein